MVWSVRGPEDTRTGSRGNGGAAIATPRTKIQVASPARPQPSTSHPAPGIMAAAAAVFGPGGALEIGEETIRYASTSVEDGTPPHQASGQTYRVYKSSPYGLTLPELWQHARGAHPATAMAALCSGWFRL